MPPPIQNAAARTPSNDPIQYHIVQEHVYVLPTLCFLVGNEGTHKNSDKRIRMALALCSSNLAFACHIVHVLILMLKYMTS